VLGWLLTNEPSDGGDLAAEWVEDERGLAPILAQNEEGLPKAGRKVVRRLRHQLRSRGVELPEGEATEVVATLPQVEQPLDEALLSPIDPRGTRAAFLVTSHPSGGARLFELLLDELRGVLDVRVYNTGRSQVRRFIKSFRQRDEFPAVDVSPDAVRALVQRVAESQPEGRPLPNSFREWRAQLASAPEEAATPGELAREALGDVEPEPSVLRRAAEEVSAGRIGPWPPAPEVLQPLGERLTEAAKGQIIVSGSRRREQLDEVLLDALEEIFADSFGAATASRFDETAYWMWKRDREEDARVCLAAGRAFREMSARDNPVARAMVEAILGPLLGRLEEEIQGEDEKSRIVQGHPGEASS